MKQVKLLFTVFVLFIAIGIPQNIVSQNSNSSQMSFNIIGKWIPNNGDSEVFYLFKSDGTMILYSDYSENDFLNKETVPGMENYTYKIKAGVTYCKWELNGNILSIIIGNTKKVLGDNSNFSDEIQQRIWADKIKHDKAAFDYNDNDPMKMTIISCTPELITIKNEGGKTVLWKRDLSMTNQQVEADINKQLDFGNPKSSSELENDYLASKSYNIVGKWIIQDGSSYLKFNKDGTGLIHITVTRPYNIKEIDIDFVVKANEHATIWSLDENKITVDRINRKIILGDNSLYPADIQKQIKEYKENLEQSYHKGYKDVFYIASLSPDTLKVKFEDGSMFDWIRDTSDMTPQELNQYKKDVANWNKKIKEEKDAELKAKLAKDNILMTKLKIKALSSGDIYDHWIIGHMYEFGEGNGDRITICLDSALVWYKKAAAIDSNYQRYVTAVSHKIKTGGDYYKDKEKAEVDNAKRRIANLRQKYGAVYVNSLMNTGNIKVGTPVALLEEYIPLFNRIYSAIPLELHYYEPTTRDMQQYGRNAKRVEVNNGLYSFMVVNGKVVTVYQQSSWLKVN